MKNVPRAGEQLRISINSDATLCNPGETVTVMKVEPAPGGFYLHVDGRRELRRFFWSTP